MSFDEVPVGYLFVHDRGNLIYLKVSEQHVRPAGADVRLAEPGEFGVCSLWFPHGL